MKLLRYGEPGHEMPGVLDDNGNVRSLKGIVDDIDGAALSSGRLDGIVVADLPVVENLTRLGPCVGKVGKFLCVGLNYLDHAAESGMPVPQEPEIFSKATSAICGPNDDIIQPCDSEKLDWEVELAIVIGRDAAYVPESTAHEFIAGYCVCNDVSERGFQLERGSQWDKGKGCDTFGPIGPWLVTPEEIADPLNLDMWLEVNGHRYQDGSTRTMIFGPAFIVSYLSRFMTLKPGDVITTGTPPGVGLGQKPRVYLKPGDRIALGISSLGIQRQTVVAHNR
jgi:2-keto-4-pentenoate hydratase/2-oxohepta-3-ene-1,7-dioic acid hydratase in catechol pathway